MKSNVPGLVDMMDRLLDQLDPEVASLHSFNHFHARGMVYINLHRSAELTAKLYLIDPTIVHPLPNGYLVNPHDHAYRFHTLVAAGQCTNYTFAKTFDMDFDSNARRYWHHEFHSALNGAPGKVINKGQCTLYETSATTMRVEEGYYCDEQTIHTISVHDSHPTVLFLLQYKDIRAPTNLYTRDAVPPSLAGLYERLTPKQVTAHAIVVREWIEAARQE